MPKQYEVTPVVRFVNRIGTVLTRAGIGPASMHLLTVPGRKTGNLYTTMVALVTQNDTHYLISPYGEVNWIQNARAAGQVTLQHGSHIWKARLEELGPTESAPVLKAYIAQNSMTRPYFDAAPDAPLETFVQEAPHHPVFRLIPV